MNKCTTEFYSGGSEWPPSTPGVNFNPQNCIAQAKKTTNYKCSASDAIVYRYKKFIKPIIASATIRLGKRFSIIHINLEDNPGRKPIYQSASSLPITDKNFSNEYNKAKVSNICFKYNPDFTKCAPGVNNCGKDQGVITCLDTERLRPGEPIWIQPNKLNCAGTIGGSGCTYTPIMLCPRLNCEDSSRMLSYTWRSEDRSKPQTFDCASVLRNMRNFLQNEINLLNSNSKIEHVPLTNQEVIKIVLTRYPTAKNIKINRNFQWRDSGYFTCPQPPSPFDPPVWALGGNFCDNGESTLVDKIDLTEKSPEKTEFKKFNITSCSGGFQPPIPSPGHAGLSNLI